MITKTTGHNETIPINGDLTFSTVINLWKQNLPLLAQFSDIVIDLKNVTYCDSSSLALLIEWQLFAKKQNKSITFINAPQQLLKIAQVAHLYKILNFV
ncbi:MAG: STAS domain-containing protein [Gammaproteobacteria bacterium]|nr:STAS domain-containing protein [Gammaproteobacteria bacterium]